MQWRYSGECVVEKVCAVEGVRVIHDCFIKRKPTTGILEDFHFITLADSDLS